jgi:hypothetical protein
MIGECNHQFGYGRSIMGIKHIHGSTTSLNGCKVDIDGDVEYSIIPLRINGFHGAVHLNGEKDVPNGDLYFGIEPSCSTPILEFGERKSSEKKGSTGK